MPLLSLLDDRSKPKGSRDPLGFELVWSTLGRNVIGNLTTITSSLENFTTALLGFYWANELASESEPTARNKQIREYFLRYEQVAAYLRRIGQSNAIMGINRVSQRMNEQNKIAIGTGKEQILSNQASYGLWGLYSSAMRDTGLIRGNDRELTESGLQIALQLEALVDKPAIQEMISAKEISIQRLESYSAEFMDMLANPAITLNMLEQLLVGITSSTKLEQEQNCLQQELWRHTQELVKNRILMSNKDSYINELLNKNISPPLKSALKEITVVDEVLAAINNIFQYCQTQHGVELEKVIKTLEDKEFDFSYLPDELPQSNYPRKDQISMILKQIKSYDFTNAITMIIDLNKVVMQKRGGAAWIRVDENKKLDVLIKSESAKLLNTEELRKKWAYDYFIGSFLTMALTYQNLMISEGK
ncbi:hypothetical protein L8R80_10465 [Vibrio splendidus]|uniref:hypothetical protein n=1 Tax=Vibrio splendidus TaxID=29497 RepID=UPI000C84A34F|nr:hypothetical protein [Vibrio splendidus]MDH5913634.1 hypothetical protein [Vibrio splendidus]MDH5941698.1 hypothetical protein [Vibrio splendidus]MDH5987260.1 hypothetical protein [Vibrio splendidus]MDH5993662.1 hypothetical protein [Vibrio splendidus]MDH6007060.1 hypothetical protein [Vibrio splendidus]